MNFDLQSIQSKIPTQALDTVSVEGPRGLTFQPNYIQAIAIVALLFLLILMMGQFRKRLLDWHMNGFMPGIIVGVVVTLFLEGFLIIGGRTALTEVFGWENPPSFIAGALDGGKTKLAGTLGATDEVPESHAMEISIDDALQNYNLLTPADASSFRSLVCSQGD